MSRIHLLEHRERIGLLLGGDGLAQDHHDRICVGFSPRRDPDRHRRKVPEADHCFALEAAAAERCHEPCEMRQVQQRMREESSLNRIGNERRHQSCDDFGLVALVQRCDRRWIHAENPMAALNARSCLSRSPEAGPKWQAGDWRDFRNHEASAVSPGTNAGELTSLSSWRIARAAAPRPDRCWRQRGSRAGGRYRGNSETHPRGRHRRHELDQLVRREARTVSVRSAPLRLGRAAGSLPSAIYGTT